MTEERWLPVVGYEGFYEVSDFGRVRTVPRTVKMGRGWRRIPERVRRMSVNNAGYFTIALSRNNVVRHRSVHPLVLEAFVGPRPPGMECCHNDGNRQNNALSNLRWDSKRANELDAIRMGNRPDPDRTHCTYGHELTEANTYFTKARPNTRQCRKCLSVYNARNRAKRKARLQRPA